MSYICKIKWETSINYIIKDKEANASIYKSTLNIELYQAKNKDNYYVGVNNCKFSGNHSMDKFLF